jgi:chemotaxis protein methyltransferase CheR
MAAPVKKQSPASGAWMEEIAGLVNEITGVKLGVRQSAMLEARLLKRMVQLGHTEPKAYLDYLRANRDSELEKLVGLLTTHHTFFFREFIHFEFLEEKSLPMLIEQVRKRADKTLRVWSAACSQGQEVYSLAMFLQMQLKRLAPEIKIDILGTDVDPESIAIARNGVYRWNDLKQVPMHYLANHWVRGTEEIAEYAKARPSIKSVCRFEVGNLLELDKQKPSEMFDVVALQLNFLPLPILHVNHQLINYWQQLHPG